MGEYCVPTKTIYEVLVWDIAIALIIVIVIGSLLWPSAYQLSLIPRTDISAASACSLGNVKSVSVYPIEYGTWCKFECVDSSKSRNKGTAGSGALCG